MIYPYLEIQCLLGIIEQNDYISIANDTYTLKVFIHTDSVTSTEILQTDPNLVIKLFGINASSDVESGIRYLYPIGVGECKIDAFYLYGINTYEVSRTFNIYREGTYPKLRLVPYLNDVEQLKFLDIENVTYEIRIKLMLSDTEEVTIPINDTALTIKQCDHNINFYIDTNVGYINLLETGTSRINVYYTYGGKAIYLHEDILIYDPFFRNNYRTHLLTQFDYSNFEETPRLRITFDVMMEFLDILYAYSSDIQHMNDIMRVKERFLDLYAISIGFERDNTYDGTYLEWSFNKLFRELVAVLLDLIQLRGTKLSYELFFSALGYDIELLEYWFNEDGYLIEINYDDVDLSTFYLYRTDGSPVEDNPIPHIDPRKDVNASNEYNYVNKSKYVRPELTPTSGVYNPNAFSTEQRAIIKKYLDWLRPNHIEYLQEVLHENITQFGPGPYDYGEHMDMMRTLEANFSSNLLYITPCTYINMAGVYTALAPLGYVPVNPGWPYWVPPPALLDNAEYDYHGCWSWETRGLCIEHLPWIAENVIIGVVLNWSDRLEQPIYYDVKTSTGDFKYDYDEVEPDSIGLHYDVGILLEEAALEYVNLIIFEASYTQKLNVYGYDAAVQQLMYEFNISQERCENIISIL